MFYLKKFQSGKVCSTRLECSAGWPASPPYSLDGRLTAQTAHLTARTAPTVVPNQRMDNVTYIWDQYT